MCCSAAGAGLQVFQWHDYGCELPAGAVTLARSERAPQQAVPRRGRGLGGAVPHRGRRRDDGGGRAPPPRSRVPAEQSHPSWSPAPGLRGRVRRDRARAHEPLPDGRAQPRRWPGACRRVAQSVRGSCVNERGSLGCVERAGAPAGSRGRRRLPKSRAAAPRSSPDPARPPSALASHEPVRERAAGRPPVWRSRGSARDGRSRGGGRRAPGTRPLAAGAGPPKPRRCASRRRRTSTP